MTDTNSHAPFAAIEPLLERAEGESGPIVLMTCGMAGMCKTIPITRCEGADAKLKNRIRENNSGQDCARPLSSFPEIVNR